MNPPQRYLRFVRTLVVVATAGCQPVAVLVPEDSIDVQLDAIDSSNDAGDQGIDAHADAVAEIADRSIDTLTPPPLQHCSCFDPTEDAGDVDVFYCTPGTYTWFVMNCGAGAGPQLPPDLPA